MIRIKVKGYIVCNYHRVQHRAALGADGRFSMYGLHCKYASIIIISQ